MDVKGSVALISGGASGLGLAAERMQALEPRDGERGVLVCTASVAAFDARSAKPRTPHPRPAWRA